MAESSQREAMLNDVWRAAGYVKPETSIEIPEGLNYEQALMYLRGQLAIEAARSLAMKKVTA